MSYNRSLTFESSDNRCKLIDQYSVLLFILTFDWLMEKYQELDGLFKAELNVPAKNYPIYFKFGQLSKINKKKLGAMTCDDLLYPTPNNLLVMISFSWLCSVSLMNTVEKKRRMKKIPRSRLSFLARETFPLTCTLIFSGYL